MRACEQTNGLRTHPPIPPARVGLKAAARAGERVRAEFVRTRFAALRTVPPWRKSRGDARGNGRLVQHSLFSLIVVLCTAYCPCALCTDGDGLTATGRDAMIFGVAVDPRIIPLGAHLDIPGYRRGPNRNGSWIRADDMGRLIKGYRIDVRCATHAEAVAWGTRKIRVRVWRDERRGRLSGCGFGAGCPCRARQRVRTVLIGLGGLKTKTIALRASCAVYGQ